jgi:hypothetical protein
VDRRLCRVGLDVVSRAFEIAVRVRIGKARVWPRDGRCGHDRKARAESPQQPIATCERYARSRSRRLLLTARVPREPGFTRAERLGPFPEGREPLGAIRRIGPGRDALGSQLRHPAFLARNQQRPPDVVVNLFLQPTQLAEEGVERLQGNRGWCRTSKHDPDWTIDLADGE